MTQIITKNVKLKKTGKFEQVQYIKCISFNKKSYFLTPTRALTEAVFELKAVEDGNLAFVVLATGGGMWLGSFLVGRGFPNRTFVLCIDEELLLSFFTSCCGELVSGGVSSSRGCSCIYIFKFNKLTYLRRKYVLRFVDFREKIPKINVTSR